MKNTVKLLSMAVCLYAVSCNSDKKNADVVEDAAMVVAESVDTMAVADTMATQTTDSLVAEQAADSVVAISTEWTEEGSLLGKFSVSPTCKINFSKGNLQYQASTNTWRFAKHQYTIIGAENVNIYKKYDGWIDLFGWATSGYNGKDPSMAIVKLSEYGDGKNDIAGTNYDWGVYNAISNGGNKAGAWRTLTGDEWKYLFSKRANAKNLFACGIVGDVRGLILLPDRFKCPDGLTFNPSLSFDMKYESDFYINSAFDNFTHNVYTVEEWQSMENAGAVFLPMAGFRYERLITDNEGGYWLSSCRTVNSAFSIVFTAEKVGTDKWYARYYGRSVRLVQNAK